MAKITTAPVDRAPIPVLKERTARIALLILFCGAVGIAFTPIFVRWSEVGPAATAFWRLSLALPAFWLWSGLEGRRTPATRRPQTLSDYRRLALAGLFFTGDLAVWHWSLHYTSVANATLLVNCAPLFVTLGAWLFFRQRVTLTFILGMCGTLSGMVLLVGSSFTLGEQHILGDLLGLAAAFFYSGYILSVKRLRNEFSTVTIMAWSGLVACVVLLPITWLSGEVLWVSTVQGWLALAGLAFISQLGGQSLITHALAHLPAPFSSVSLLLQPVIAALLAWLLLQEALGLWQAIGGLIVLTGIYVARRGS